jgi:hypothetical protein
MERTQHMPTPELSVVRKNILTVPGYTPYCGADRCPHDWPRTTCTGEQFKCSCGWQSEFEPGFVQQARAALSSAKATP